MLEDKDTREKVVMEAINRINRKEVMEDMDRHETNRQEVQATDFIHFINSSFKGDYPTKELMKNSYLDLDLETQHLDYDMESEFSDEQAEGVLQHQEGGNMNKGSHQ